MQFQTRIHLFDFVFFILWLLLEFLSIRIQSLLVASDIKRHWYLHQFHIKQLNILETKFTIIIYTVMCRHSSDSSHESVSSGHIVLMIKCNR